jgi:hypothetical protein
MQEPSEPKGQYFSPSTGEPLAWYAKTPDGAIEVFTLPGFHPKYGTKLLPVTADIIAAYEKQRAEEDRQRQEKTEAQKQRDHAEAAQRAKAEAIRKARAEADRQAREEARLNEPLQAGRYLFQDPRPTGTVDRLKFTLSEVDLKPEAMLIHLEVENVGVDARAETPAGERRTIRLNLVSQDGAITKRSAIHIKEGALAEGKNSIIFPSVGKKGAFVMEFPRQEDPTTFSITVNDHPIFSAINLHSALFQSF